MKNDHRSPMTLTQMGIVFILLTVFWTTFAMLLAYAWS